MTKFSLTDFKKELNQKTKKELINEISNLCKKFPQIKEYYQDQYRDPIKVLEKYKDIIEKEFVHGKTRGCPKARLNVAKKAIQGFKKVNDNPVLLADIMLRFVECVSAFNSDFGVDEERYYTSPEDLFNKTLKLLKSNNLLQKFNVRASQIVENACQSWGHYDTLSDIYAEYYFEINIQG